MIKWIYPVYSAHFQQSYQFGYGQPHLRTQISHLTSQKASHLLTFCFSMTMNLDILDMNAPNPSFMLSRCNISSAYTFKSNLIHVPTTLLNLPIPFKVFQRLQQHYAYSQTEATSEMCLTSLLHFSKISNWLPGLMIPTWTIPGLVISKDLHIWILHPSLHSHIHHLSIDLENQQLEYQQLLLMLPAA